MSVYKVTRAKFSLPKALEHAFAGSHALKVDGQSNNKGLKCLSGTMTTSDIKVVVSFEINYDLPSQLPSRTTPDKDNYTVLKSSERFEVSLEDLPPHPVYGDLASGPSEFEDILQSLGTVTTQRQDVNGESNGDARGSSESSDKAERIIEDTLGNCGNNGTSCSNSHNQASMIPKLTYSDEHYFKLRKKSEGHADTGTAQVPVLINIPSIIDQIDFVLDNLGALYLEEYAQALCALLLSQGCPSGCEASEETSVDLLLSLEASDSNKVNIPPAWSTYNDTIQEPEMCILGQVECLDVNLTSLSSLFDSGKSISTSVSYFSSVARREYNKWGIVDVLYERSDNEGMNAGGEGGDSQSRRLSSCGLYRLRIAPGHMIPIHYHSIMEESEMVVRGTRLAVYGSFGADDLRAEAKVGIDGQSEERSNKSVGQWHFTLPYKSQCRPAQGASFKWKCGERHGYANASLDEWAEVLCIDRPKFIPGDEHVCADLEKLESSPQANYVFGYPGDSLWLKPHSFVHSIEYPGTYQDQKVKCYFVGANLRKSLQSKDLSVPPTTSPDAVLALSYLESPISISGRQRVSPRNEPHVILVNHKKRGWEVPGGKVDYKADDESTKNGLETSMEAAEREWMEETGFVLENNAAGKQEKDKESICSTNIHARVRHKESPVHLMRYVIREDGKTECTHTKDVILLPLEWSPDESPENKSGGHEKDHVAIFRHETKGVGLYPLRWIDYNSLLLKNHSSAANEGLQIISPLLLDSTFACALRMACLHSY